MFFSENRRPSLSSGEKLASDLQPHQAAYSQDRARAESEPDPGRDIELELCALDLEDSDQQEAQVGRTDRKQSSTETYMVKKTHISVCVPLRSLLTRRPPTSSPLPAPRHSSHRL